MTMAPTLQGLGLRKLAGAAPVWRGALQADAWREACETAASQGGRLCALWASDDRDLGVGFTVHALLGLDDSLACLDLSVAGPGYPDLSDLFPWAGRMQRGVRDLMGLDAGTDHRGWLDHGTWGARHPLRRDSAPLPPGSAQTREYAFRLVEGDGVHEIPVGPVHAGIIEPGHFRFSAVGERVLKLEERLGYTHKGIEKRFESMSIAEGARLAGRVSGDSTVAFAWAYCMALESAAGIEPAPRALWLRALLLERERVANHLGDLGALGNDAGLAFGLAQFSRLKEDVLRLNARLFGHRYLMETLIPGGVARDVSAAAADELVEEAQRLQDELLELRAIYNDHAGLQDRCINCGHLSGPLAARLGVVGLAARASGIAMDARIFPALAPYDRLRPAMAVQRNGDVAARIAVRFDEVLESLRLQSRIAADLPATPILSILGDPPARSLGIGWVEGWRGEVFVALETAADGRIRRCHPHDPSWQNWPALEHAVIGNIVPDFPLINKSFNLSYAGVDL